MSAYREKPAQSYKTNVESIKVTVRYAASNRSEMGIKESSFTGVIQDWPNKEVATMTSATKAFKSFLSSLENKKFITLGTTIIKVDNIFTIESIISEYIVEHKYPLETKIV